MPRRRTNEITHETASGQRSVWRGRRPRGENTTHSWRAFVGEAKRTKNGQAHLAKHHRGYRPNPSVIETLEEAGEDA